MHVHLPLQTQASCLALALALAPAAALAETDLRLTPARLHQVDLGAGSTLELFVAPDWIVRPLPLEARDERARLVATPTDGDAFRVDLRVHATPKPLRKALAAEAHGLLMPSPVMRELGEIADRAQAATFGAWSDCRPREAPDLDLWVTNGVVRCAHRPADPASVRAAGHAGSHPHGLTAVTVQGDNLFVGELRCGSLDDPVVDAFLQLVFYPAILADGIRHAFTTEAPRLEDGRIVAGPLVLGPPAGMTLHAAPTPRSWELRRGGDLVARLTLDELAGGAPAQVEARIRRDRASWGHRGIACADGTLGETPIRRCRSSIPRWPGVDVVAHEDAFLATATSTWVLAADLEPGTPRTTFDALLAALDLGSAASAP